MTDVIPRFGFRVKIGAACEMGSRRQTLQDGYLVSKALGVVAIADGMGGKWGGELAAGAALSEVERAMASETTERVALKYLQSPDLESRRIVLARLRRVVVRAHECVRKLGLEQNEPRELGTTLDVAWLLRNEVFLAHVGDARVYVVRANAVLQVSEDHAESVTRSRLSHTAKLPTHPLTRLYNAVGIGEHVNVDTLLLDLRKGDRLVFTTDGVWSALDGESQLEQWVRGVKADEAAKALVHFAKGKSFDDRTAVVVQIGDRLVRHQATESDATERDIGPVAESALFAGLPWPKVFVALSVAVYVEFAAEQTIPFHVAGDRAAYVVLDGIVRGRGDKRMGRGATLYGESLVGCEPCGMPYVCDEPVRAIRIRRDDYHEVCASDPVLATELYRRLAEHLGQRLAL